MPFAGCASSVKACARCTYSAEDSILLHLLAICQEATVHLGVGLTTLKKICRKHNITRWPQRQRSRLSGLVDKVDGSMSEKLGIHRGRT